MAPSWLGKDRTWAGRHCEPIHPGATLWRQGPAVGLALGPAGWGDRGQVTQPQRPHLSNENSFCLVQLAAHQCDDDSKAFNTGWVHLSKTPLFRCRLLIWVGEGETGSLEGVRVVGMTDRRTVWMGVHSVDGERRTVWMGVHVVDRGVPQRGRGRQGPWS